MKSQRRPMPKSQETSAANPEPFDRFIIDTIKAGMTDGRTIKDVHQSGYDMNTMPCRGCGEKRTNGGSASTTDVKA